MVSRISKVYYKYCRKRSPSGRKFWAEWPWTLVGIWQPCPSYIHNTHQAEEEVGGKVHSCRHKINFSHLKLTFLVPKLVGQYVILFFYS